MKIPLIPLNKLLLELFEESELEEFIVKALVKTKLGPDCMQYMDVPEPMPGDTPDFRALPTQRDPQRKMHFLSS